MHRNPVIWLHEKTEGQMNGAETLVKTLLASGVTVCFANLCTSEMHFVHALDQHPKMRCILCLFEGGVSGAADGYYRMKGEVAATSSTLPPALEMPSPTCTTRGRRSRGRSTSWATMPTITCASRPR